MTVLGPGPAEIWIISHIYHRMYTEIYIYMYIQLLANKHSHTPHFHQYLSYAGLKTDTEGNI